MSYKDCRLIRVRIKPNAEPHVASKKDCVGKLVDRQGVQRPRHYATEAFVGAIVQLGLFFDINSMFIVIIPSTQVSM